MKRINIRQAVKLTVHSGDKQCSAEHSRILEELFQTHGSALRSFLMARVRNVAQVEDVIQEIFLRLAKRCDVVDQMKGVEHRNRAYLFSAANNLLVDMERRNAVRRRYVDKECHEDSHLAYELTPEIVVSATQELTTMKESIKNMKPTWRTALILSRFKSMSAREIAIHMGVSSRQVENYIASAIKVLRRSESSRSMSDG